LVSVKQAGEASISSFALSLSDLEVDLVAMFGEVVPLMNPRLKGSLCQIVFLKSMIS
jgi:hypothetical protein